jgi:hypothetical protein
MHLLPNGNVYVSMKFGRDESELTPLDIMTSSIIRRGGSINTNSRKSLDKISPYLAKRMIGYSNLPI